MTRRPWDLDRDREMRVAIGAAMHDYMVSYVTEHGGGLADGLREASNALIQIHHRSFYGGQQRTLDRTQFGRGVIREIYRHQERVAATICSEGGTWWIAGGRNCRWHKVATLTRAHCGQSINGGEHAWVLAREPEDPDGMCGLCKRR